jgi:hypothetical protein
MSQDQMMQSIKKGFMNLQTDIKWIVKELQEIQDPDFIKAIKSMLQYRKKRYSPKSRAATSCRRADFQHFADIFFII